jgi:hypothetical protein
MGLKEVGDPIPTRNLGVKVSCPLHGPQKPAFACDHCLRQDEIHPAGIVKFAPRVAWSCLGFEHYLCAPCFASFGEKPKLLALQMMITCPACLREEIKRIEGVKCGSFVDVTRTVALGEG